MKQLVAFTRDGNTHVARLEDETELQTELQRLYSYTEEKHGKPETWLCDTFDRQESVAQFLTVEVLPGGVFIR